MDLSSAIVTIDTREKDQQRVHTVETAFRNNNASVTLHKCEYVDYVITGFYRGNEMNIGIEYKTFDDFLLNRDKLPDRLFHALETYDTVALFVEMDSKDISYDTNNDTMTLISPTDYVVRQKHQNVGHIVTTTITQFENGMASFSKWGVECRTIFYSPRQIPYSMFALIRHSTKDSHKGLRLKYDKETNNSDAIFKNMMTQVPGVGVATVNKLMGYGIATLKDAVGTKVEEFERVLGKKKGNSVYMALR